MLNYFLKKLYHGLFPYTCVLCGNTSEINKDLCGDCRDELPWLQHSCQRCGREFSAAVLSHGNCGECLTNPPIFQLAKAAFHYQSPIDKLILHLKFSNKLINAKLLGELLADNLVEFYLQKKLPELIIPVPLHPKRLQERGFNQALELARPIARKFKIPIDFNSCQRIRATESQSIITAKQRRKNVRNAFIVPEKLTAKYVAIVDDVMTTGHTANELSRALFKVGVEKIDVWCCARTGLKHN